MPAKVMHLAKQIFLELYIYQKNIFVDIHACMNIYIYIYRCIKDIYRYVCMCQVCVCIYIYTYMCYPPLAGHPMNSVCAVGRSPFRVLPLVYLWVSKEWILIVFQLGFGV